VCVNPICGCPSTLGIYAPVIYDELGVNLCTTFDLGVDISTLYPTADSISVQIIDISYDYGEGGVVITQLPGRRNCYSITLTNLLVEVVIGIYDINCRLLDTIQTSVEYLPSDTTSPNYDEDTNPSSVTLEIFAPYGVSYNATTTPATVALNYIGFTSENNYTRQGLNLYGIAKVLDFDATDSTATVGISLVVQSLYFAGYKVPTEGKVDTPKGSTIPADQTECICFVEGDVLNLAIKPLEIGCPENEQNLKVIQEIMGHSSIETTMDVYNEATLQKKKESFAGLEGKIKIS
jgi:hypothetical protein